MLRKANQTSFKKGNIPINKGNRKYEFKCTCGKVVKTSDKRKKSCSHSCATKESWKNRERKGYIDGGYKRFQQGKVTIREHRLIWEENNGKIPKGHHIHHINENKLDNRLENLQILSISEHSQLHWDKRKGVI